MINRIISFTEYSLIREHNEFLESSSVMVTEAANLDSNINKNIKFGIIMATHRIEKGIKANGSGTPKYVKDALTSIFNQTHDNFKVYICADAYPEEHLEELTDVIDQFPKDKIWFHNLPKPGERDTPAEDKTFPGSSRYGISSYSHACGGTTCWNTCIKQMKSDGIKYFCKLDHDDKWKNNHLELHAKGYTQYPDSAIISTRAKKKNMRGKSIGGYRYMPEKDIKDIDYDNIKMNHITPFSGSAISWSADTLGSLKFRDWQAQVSTSPRRSEVLHTDSDWYLQVIDTLKKKNLKLLYIPKVTNPLRNADGKF